MGSNLREEGEDQQPCHRRHVLMKHEIIGAARRRERPLALRVWERHQHHTPIRREVPPPPTEQCIDRPDERLRRDRTLKWVPFCPAQGAPRLTPGTGVVAPYPEVFAELGPHSFLEL